MYDEKYDMWTGFNIQMPMANVDTIEIFDSLARYEAKSDIVRSDSEFTNLLDKVLERRRDDEMARATDLLVKFADVRYNKIEPEKNPHKRNGMRKQAIQYYEKAIDFGKKLFDMAEIEDVIAHLRKDIVGADTQQASDSGST